MGSEKFVTGGTAEIAQFTIDTIWHPWLKQLKMRRAIVHAIDRQAIVGCPLRGGHHLPGQPRRAGRVGDYHGKHRSL